MFVSKNDYGTEVIYGNAGIAIVPGEGVMVRDYADGQIPDIATVADAAIATTISADINADFRGGVTCLIDTQLCGAGMRVCRPFLVTVGHGPRLSWARQPH